MPIILWLLGVPVTLVLVLWFFGIVRFKARAKPMQRVRSSPADQEAESGKGLRNFSAVFAHVMEKAVEHKGNVVKEQPAGHFNERRHCAATVKIRGVVVAGRALRELDAEPEIGAALRCHTLRGTCTVQSCRRNVQFPRLRSNLDSAVLLMRQSIRGRVSHRPEGTVQGPTQSI
ncbi:MAG: hypothetical protein EHM80_07585 [Nitrospiraceae bacterium]|nr:MAG: hypothetical protein EHM80_07585 [Nitrospiraceae bacterium]